jgi:tetratricopeptide (TPR) repeat protein
MEKMHDDELAERYVLGDLNPGEKEQFEHEMNLRPELKKQVDLLNGISAAILDQDLIEFRTMVKEESAEYKVSRKGQRVRRLLVRASFAAATIVLVAATFFVLSVQGNKAASSVKVFSEFYNPYSSGLVSRSSSENGDELYSQAIRQYGAMLYKSASASFEEILAKNPDNNGALFFSGMTYMELKDYKKAALRFNTVLINGNSLYVQQAEWYMGLSLLAVNDRKNALLHFRNLATGAGYYYSKAKLVLKELKED